MQIMKTKIRKLQKIIKKHVFTYFSPPEGNFDTDARDGVGGWVGDHGELYYIILTYYILFYCILPPTNISQISQISSISSIQTFNQFDGSMRRLETLMRRPTRRMLHDVIILVPFLLPLTAPGFRRLRAESPALSPCILTKNE